MKGTKDALFSLVSFLHPNKIAHPHTTNSHCSDINMLSTKYAMCVALKSFHASNSEEVDCVQDDLLEIISTLDDQWLVVIIYCCHS